MLTLIPCNDLSNKPNKIHFVNDENIGQILITAFIGILSLLLYCNMFFASE